MYEVGITLYTWLFRVVALFNPKAAKMIHGQQETWQLLSQLPASNRSWLWFHAASLGEFEQGRPIMEKIKLKYPDKAILLTFYSPSGYEVRKDYAGADLVCYLPFDRKNNVRHFLRLVKPAAAFFIKYEFWPNYLRELRAKEIPTYLISGIFRKDQLFFKPYGSFYRKLLACFTHLFVQDEQSVQLLKSIGYDHHVTQSGDTRFDRVLEIKRQALDFPLVDAFVRSGTNEPVLVAGSTWPKDELLLISYFNHHPGIKLIIAPHVVDETHLKLIDAPLTRPSVRFSQADLSGAAQADCLLIDCYGMLSSIYRYGQVAYVGGGFGAGIHNTLEAAVYSIPVLFGPNYTKFTEAKQLLERGGAVCIHSQKELNDLLDKWLANPLLRETAGKAAGAYLEEGSGSTDKIISMIYGS
jgi:3-deoxy-D-manno-octulosonic-acid transferase